MRLAFTGREIDHYTSRNLSYKRPPRPDLLRPLARGLGTSSVPSYVNGMIIKSLNIIRDDYF